MNTINSILIGDLSVIHLYTEFQNGRGFIQKLGQELHVDIEFNLNLNLLSYFTNYKNIRN